MDQEIDRETLLNMHDRFEKRIERSGQSFNNLVAAISTVPDEWRKEVDENSATKELADRQIKAGEQLSNVFASMRDGGTTRLDAGEQLHKHLQRLREDESRGQVANLLRRSPRRDYAEVERVFQEHLGALGDEGIERLIGLDTGGDHIGGESRFLAKRRGDDDVGVRQDALEDPPAPLPPLNVCFGPAHMDSMTNSRFDGLAFPTNFASATPATGRFSCMPFVMVLPALPGGAATDQALLADTVTWTSSFTQMKVTADIAIRLNMAALAIAFSGAGASADLKIDALFDTGEFFTGVLPLGTVVAPIFWYSQSNSTGTRRVILSTSVNPAARSVVLSAGGLIHTAAFGFSGSFAQGILSGTVTSLCVSLT